jgi:hypothetical protein
VREKVGTQFSADVRKQAVSNPDARWFVNLYDAAHQPLANGHPPLTRQMADAYLDLRCFFAEQSGQSCGDVSKLRSEWASALAKRYSGLRREQQEEIGKAPLYLASVRIVWPTLPEQQKADFLRAFNDRNSKSSAEAKAAAPAKALPRESGRTSEMSPERQAELLNEIQSKHLCFMNMSSIIARSPYRYY